MSLGFGTWRFFLAFLVAISHLWKSMIHGPAAYAVWGFFVLSGFLMTHVLKNKYGQTKNGLTDYAYNRFLRIFPAYWIACLLGLLTLAVVPEQSDVDLTKLNPEFVLPLDLSSWIHNLTLLPIFDTTGALVPVSGALSTEVGVYILIPLMAFSRGAAWLGLILSFALNIKYGLGTDMFPLRYSSFLTCFGVFSLGSLAAHYRAELARFEFPRLSLIAWLAHCTIWLWYDPWPWTYGLYSSALLSGWVVLSLSARKTGKMDTFLGDLSYPVYLFHTTVAAWVAFFFSGFKTFNFFLISFVGTVLISWLIVELVDKKLARIKKRRVLS